VSWFGKPHTTAHRADVLLAEAGADQDVHFGGVHVADVGDRPVALGEVAAVVGT